MQATRPSGYGLLDENYEYDRVGNRETPGNPNQYVYDDNHRITQGPGLTYSYDDDGNQAGRSDGATFGYDTNNRLVRYSKAGMSATYVYGSFGRRIQKTVDGVAIFYLWDEKDLLGEYSSTGVRIQRYAYFPNKATPIQSQDSHGIYSVHDEYLQAPKFMTNAEQQVVWSSNLQAFGAATISSDPDGDGNSVTFNVRFPG